MGNQRPPGRVCCLPSFQDMNARSAGVASRHLADGEFGWGGISVTRQRRCPKASSERPEISRSTQG